jgi:TonB family protein
VLPGVLATGATRGELRLETAASARGGEVAFGARLPLGLILVAVAAYLFRPAIAEAEPGPTGGDEIAPPVALSTLTADYPAGGRGDARVVLELVVRRDGSVGEVRLLDGAEPFAQSARVAARDFHFSPALRRGRPVAARIRVEVQFRRPPEVPAAPPPRLAPAPPTADAPGSERAAPAFQQVLVQGARLEPTAVTLGKAEIHQLPGALGDPFRSIEALPGVTPIVSGAPYFYVRGAPPGNVGYYFDGIRVPLLYHFGLGPGVIHPALIDRVDLYPGAYPARYGRFAGAIVAAESTPLRRELHGEASIRLFDVGLMLEAPFAERRGGASVAGRYSYTAALLSLLSPKTPVEYWDYQVRVEYELSERSRLTLFSFGAYDYLGQEQDDGHVDTQFATEFHRFDLRFDHRASADTEFKLATTLGLDRTRADGDYDDTLSAADRLVGLRGEVRHRASSTMLVRGGFDATLDSYDVRVRGASEEDLAPALSDRNDLALGVYADVVIQASRTLTVTPGIRSDLFTSGGAAAVAVEPRISATFVLSDQMRLVHAFGLANQQPGFIAPLPGFRIAGLRGGLQTAVQSSAALQLDLPFHIKSSLTLFQNAYFNLADPLTIAKSTQSEDVGAGAGAGSESPSTPQGDPRTQAEPSFLETRALGRSVGVELYLRRRLSERLGGFVAYTLSSSTRSFDDVHAFSGWDRSHVLSSALSYDLGRRYRVGGRFTFYTGIPATVSDTRLLDRFPRTDAYYRLDLRFEKRWLLGADGASCALFFEMLNATLNKEAVQRECDESGHCQLEKIGPVVLPSLGFEAAF